jgi:hypothetical protein
VNRPFSRLLIAIPLACFVLWSALCTRPAYRENARQAVLQAYACAQSRDFDMGYSSDLSGAKHDLQDLHSMYGRVLSYEIISESLLTPLRMFTYELRVQREKGTYGEEVKITAGYTRSYSRDYVAFYSIRSLGAR